MSSVVISDLSVHIEATPVVRAINCAISTGSWLALLGPNGSGKTTVLRAIAGLLPYRGMITFDGATLPRRDRARLLAYVPQKPELPPDMLVADYVLLGRTPHLGYLAGPGASDRAAAATAMAQLDVTRYGARRLGTLSGGEAQRVVLARALAQQPGILLLDEPTSALDIGHQQRVLELVDELRAERGLTVISSLHDLTTAGQYAHELVLLDRGEVAAAGPAAAVLSADLIARVYAARVQVRTDASGHPAVTPSRPARARRGQPHP